jgi:prepilin-type N-terminal cleavage/methylation domain-containing protein
MNLLINATRQLRALAARIERRGAVDAGYTLIELMIVMQILAIALAVAVPNYLGLEARADKRAASSDVRNAISTAELYYTDPTKGALSYKNLTVAALLGMDPGIRLDNVVVSTDFTTYCLQKAVKGHTSLAVRGLRATAAGAVQEDVAGNCPAAGAL